MVVFKGGRFHGGQRRGFLEHRHKRDLAKVARRTVDMEQDAGLLNSSVWVVSPLAGWGCSR